LPGQAGGRAAKGHWHDIRRVENVAQNRLTAIQLCFIFGKRFWLMEGWKGRVAAPDTSGTGALTLGSLPCEQRGEPLQHGRNRAITACYGMIRKSLPREGGIETRASDKIVLDQ